MYRSDVRSAEAERGDVVRVHDDRGRFLGRAFYSDRSQITLRFLTREDVPVDRPFFSQRVRAAASFRQQVVADTDSYRVVYGEADLLPSLIVDRYADYLVIQTLNQGVERRKMEFVELLQDIFSPAGIAERNDPRVRLLEGLDQTVSVLAGSIPEEVITNINGVKFSLDLLRGQKTGDFLDQRENRRAAREYASGEVLDCFGYVGGFALTVASQAQTVESVDLAGAAIQRGRSNQTLNSIANASFREGNAFDILKQCDETGRRFHMVILDPPAFAKNRDSVPAALRGYKEINLRALKILNQGGYLITCSCSHHISESLFLQVVAEAALDAHRIVSILERRTQARDHPILLMVPETCYIKCLILKVLS